MHDQIEFDITPSLEQLASMNRVFAFYPSSVQKPAMLTDEGVTHFNEQGYVTGIRVFSSDEARAQRKYFDDLLARVTAAGGDAYSISTAHLRYGPVYDILTHPLIVACVADLLGPNVIGWGSHYFCKLPGDERAVDWHQDASYWPLTPTKTVSVWLAIDDCDSENGCMQFVTGSHKGGHQFHDASGDSKESVLGRGIASAAVAGPIVGNPLEAGEMSIHSDLLIHGSAPNRSDRRRCGLTLRYCPPDVTAGLGWNRKGVVVRGEDAAAHWSNPARPSDGDCR